MEDSVGKMEITGVEAHFLLFALDAYLGTDREGIVRVAPDGLSRRGWQELRNRLFRVHEHPSWEQ